MLATNVILKYSSTWPPAIHEHNAIVESVIEELQRRRQLIDIYDVRNNLTRYAGNLYVTQLIINYAERYPTKVTNLC